MTNQTIKVPDDEYPIIIERFEKRVVVFAGGMVIADSQRALSLREADNPSVIYFPRRDVAMHALRRSHVATYCPYKGDASHFGFCDDGEHLADAAWTYRTPYWAVAEIEDHLAFNPARVDRIEAV